MSRHPFTAEPGDVDACTRCGLPEGNARHHDEPAGTVAQARARVDRRADTLISDPDRRSIDHALAELARTGRSFSANDLRPLLPEGIPGSAVGPRFNAAARTGVIEPTGRYVMSTDPATRHRLAEWRGTAATVRAAAEQLQTTIGAATT